MSIEFTSRVLPEYLLLECKGVFEQGDALAAFTKAYSLAAEHHRDVVLIDARGVKPPPVPTLIERYDMALHIAEHYLRQLPRIRLAVLGDEPIIDPRRFGEIVAVNRGANVKVFTNEQLALDWLVPKSKSP